MKSCISKGVNHAGINAVLSKTGVPKGSFCHYFNSKHDYGTAVIEDCVSKSATMLI